MHTKFWLENLIEETTMKTQGTRERIINLNGPWGKRVGRCGLDASGEGQGFVAGSCDHGTEPLNSIKGKEFLD